MSYDHRTEGFEAYEAFVNALKVAGVPYTEEQKTESYVRGADLEHACFCGYDYDPEKPYETCPCDQGTCGHVQRLRVARFTTVSGKPMVVEEYLTVDDQDCDGTSIVGIAVYAEGERPELEAQVFGA